MKPTAFSAKQFIVCFLLGSSLTLTGQTLLPANTQPRFINPLPVPPVIDGRNGGLFSLNINQFQQWLGLYDPAGEKLFTTVWGYNGMYPGPTILAKKNLPVQVYWQNNLIDGFQHPLPHLLPVDPTIHWALSGENDWRQAGVPTVTHLHGGHSESASDGLPDAWYTPGFAKKGIGFVKGDVEPYFYRNDQQAATLWYHDHALGITRLNVYAGLAGFYLLTDDNEMSLQQQLYLPASPYDIGLVIQDRMFTTAGELYYPAQPEDEVDLETSVLPEFFGDFILVNGMAWPVLEVEPRQYRFRILNGSDSRFYNLYLSNGGNFTQIGSDDGFLPAPANVNQLLIAPGERKDVIIDFTDSQLSGQTIILKNNAKTPYPKGRAVLPQTTGQVMAFSVSKPFNNAYPLTHYPLDLVQPINTLATSKPPRKLVLFETEDEYDRLKPMLGTVDDGVLSWDAPITENPGLNETEEWDIYNATPDAHPIHLHMVNMQMISRQKFHADFDEINGKPTNIRLIGQPRLPLPEEAGWKDTWIMYPGEVTRVIARFDLEGLYVWHCHILSHEDHEMMRPYYVGNIAGNNINTIPGPTTKVQEEKQEYQVKIIPNPFSTKVMVQYTLPESAQVNINLFNDKGQQIQQVYKGQQNKGSQQFVIDGQNLANGIYVCQILINEKLITRKLVLQK